jgi:hypothetical protein
METGVLASPSLALSMPAAVPDFLLLDQKGRAHELAREGGKAVVIFVTGNGCPLARQTVPTLKDLRKAYVERGVTFWMLDANLQDDRASVAREGEELDVDRIPILLDETQAVARMLGVTHTGEVIAIGLPERRIFYRGPVDDRLAVGGQRAAAQRFYLRDALDGFLATPRVGPAGAPEPRPAAGCAVGFESARAASYSKDVAPVLMRRCGACHGAGGSRPPLVDYGGVKAATPALRRVLLERSMPPAEPDPLVGASLAEGNVLPAAEARLLQRWLEAGAPRGEPQAAPVRPVPASSAWPLGTPSFVVTVARAAAGAPRVAALPAERATAKGAWLSAVVARPDDVARAGSVSVWAVAGATRALVAEWAPGQEARPFPDGTALWLEAGTRLEVEVRDLKGATSGAGAHVAFYDAPAPPRRRYELRAAAAEALTLPAGEAEAGRGFGFVRFSRPVTINDFRPRLDRRGSWFKYEALYPSGQRETLFSLPAFAGAWRLSYRLAQPRWLPAGTLLLATSGYDNSRRNPANPAPARRLTCAAPACDELFLGVVGISEDLAAPTAGAP